MKELTSCTIPLLFNRLFVYGALVEPLQASSLLVCVWLPVTVLSWCSRTESGSSLHLMFLSLRKYAVHIAASFVRSVWNASELICTVIMKQNTSLIISCVDQCVLHILSKWGPILNSCYLFSRQVYHTSIKQKLLHRFPLSCLRHPPVLPA